MVDVDKFSKDDAQKWLREHGLQVSGNKEELLSRIKKFLPYPNLLKKIKNRTTRNKHQFQCSLNPLDIPPASAAWKTDYDSLPKVTQEVLNKYSSHKIEGSMGQQQKAIRMLQSRKIVCVKVFKDETPSICYVKAVIKKSYGHDSRPAVIMFNENLPTKSYCQCPVGASGLCCHVISLLYFLKHYSTTGEKILELTCTEQLQKWHRRVTKGSIPMIPLKDIKLKSAKLKKTSDNIACVPADPHSSKGMFLLLVKN